MGFWNQPGSLLSPESGLKYPKCRHTFNELASELKMILNLLSEVMLVMSACASTASSCRSM